MARLHMPESNEMVVARSPIKVEPLVGRWKVTARYTFRLTGKAHVAGVRVRGPGGYVLHMSLQEFRRLFKPAEDTKGNDT